MSNNKLKAWVRYDGQKKIVPSSLILQANKPKVGTWVEISADLCCSTTPCPTPDYGNWRVVTGGVAGDGVVLVDNIIDNEFTFVGPNDAEDTGWVYLTRYFAEETLLSVDYNWASFDDEGGGIPSVDWPVYWTSTTEPTGVPGDLAVRVDDTPISGTWFVTVPAGEWFSVGIYSTDSCCGRGFLSINVNISNPSYQIYLITTLQDDLDDATGNNSAIQVSGPNGNLYNPLDGFVYLEGSNSGSSGGTIYTDNPMCSSFSPYVFYFKNNAYVLINRPGTVVATGTPC
jgi:hypothetical protein